MDKYNFYVIRIYDILCLVGTVDPLRKGVDAYMYVTYDNLIQFGLLIVAIIGLVIKIGHKDKK